MSALDPTAALEAVLLAAGPDDTPDIAQHLSGGGGQPGPDDDFAGDDAPGELISPEVFAEQWSAVHDMLGGIVQSRTSNPCPLGDQARSAGGQMAAQALYAFCASTPFLASMFLSPQSSFVGQIMIVGMHGFACVQMVKASREGVAA